MTSLPLHSPAERDETGASAVEYGLLVAGIAALIILVVFAFGGAVTGLFSSTCKTVDSAVSTASASCDG